MRWGVLRATALSTLCVVAGSVALTLAAMFVLGRPLAAIPLAIAAACPLALATPTFYLHYRLLLALVQNRGELERRNGELQAALAAVRELKGLIPICSACKKIRDDSGYWNQLEAYLTEHSQVEFTHGICPDCSARIYPGSRASGGTRL